MHQSVYLYVIDRRHLQISHVSFLLGHGRGQRDRGRRRGREGGSCGFCGRHMFHEQRRGEGVAKTAGHDLTETGLVGTFQFRGAVKPPLDRQPWTKIGAHLCVVCCVLCECESNIRSDGFNDEMETTANNGHNHGKKRNK